MRKTVLAFLVFVCMCVGTIHWHVQERRAWGKWKQDILWVVSYEDSLMKETGCSLEEANAYGDILKDSFNIKKPVACPYCLTKMMIYRYGR